jgi:hypothetical protein
LAKNPFLSMWMSAANRMAGTARGHALNYARQQQSAMMNDATRAVIAFWFGAAARPSAVKRKRRIKAR